MKLSSSSAQVIALISNRFAKDKAKGHLPLVAVEETGRHRVCVREGYKRLKGLYTNDMKLRLPVIFDDIRRIADTDTFIVEIEDSGTPLYGIFDAAACVMVQQIDLDQAQPSADGIAIVCRIGDKQGLYSAIKRKWLAAIDFDQVQTDRTQGIIWARKGDDWVYIDPRTGATTAVWGIVAPLDCPDARVALALRPDSAVEHEIAMFDAEGQRIHGRTRQLIADGSGRLRLSNTALHIDLVADVYGNILHLTR